MEALSLKWRSFDAIERAVREESKIANAVAAQPPPPDGGEDRDVKMRWKSTRVHPLQGIPDSGLTPSQFASLDYALRVLGKGSAGEADNAKDSSRTHVGLGKKSTARSKDVTWVRSAAVREFLADNTLVHIDRSNLVEEGQRGSLERRLGAALLLPMHLPSQSRNPSKLQRETVKREVLATYTSSKPIFSLMMFDEEQISEYEKARLRADRLAAQSSNQKNTVPGSANTKRSTSNGTESNDDAGKKGDEDDGSVEAGTDTNVSRVSTEAKRENSDQKSQGQSNEAASPVNGLTQDQLVQMLEMMHTNLRANFNNGERVKAVRIAIQATKVLLHSTAIPQCYPSSFVLVAQVLDEFGDLVAQRLQNTAMEKSAVVATLIKRGQDASDDLIPPEAIETCYNWFLKISSIRELVPRVCVELSLLKCFKFMARKARVVSEAVVQRLSMQIRGIADPLVAAHLRWYLFMRAGELLTSPGWATSCLTQSVMDSLECVEQVSGDTLTKMWEKHEVTEERYWFLYVPALQWQIDVLSRYGSHEKLVETVKLMFSMVLDNLHGNVAFLFPLLRGFPAWAMLEVYSIEELMDIIERCKPSAYISRMRLLEVLCLALAEEQTLAIPRGERAAFLSRVWGHVSSSATPKSYIASSKGHKASDEHHLRQLLDVCGALLQFSARHMGNKQVSLLLGLTREIIHTNRSDAQDVKARESVFSMLSGLFGRVRVTQLLDSKHFVPLLRQAAPHRRHKLCRAALQLTLLVEPSELEEIPGAVLDLFVDFHDSILSESYIDNPKSRQTVREDTQLLCTIIWGILPRNNPEKRLQLLCDVRRALPGLDDVKATIVHVALKMAGELAPSSQSKKRGAAKACFAFCQVTVPAIMDPVLRTKLAGLVAGVALGQGFLVQGEAILDFALMTLEECVVPLTVRKNRAVISHDADIKDLVFSLVPLSAAAPPQSATALAENGNGADSSNPHMYAVRRLLAWNKKFNWPKHSTENGRAQLALQVLYTVSRAQQGELPSQYPRCPMTHYEKDPQFVSACEDVCTEAVTQLLDWLDRYMDILKMLQNGFSVASLTGNKDMGDISNNNSIADATGGASQDRAPAASVVAENLVSVAFDTFEACVKFGALSRSALVQLLASTSWSVVQHICATVPSITYSKHMVATAIAAQTALGGGDVFERCIPSLITAKERYEELKESGHSRASKTEGMNGEVQTTTTTTHKDPEQQTAEESSVRKSL